MADEPADNSAEQQTIEGLWAVLLSLVPRRRRFEARALANTLHYFIERAPERALHAARRESYDAGFEAGQKHEQDRALALMRKDSRPDGPLTVEEEMRANLLSDREPTQH